MADRLLFGRPRLSRIIRLLGVGGTPLAAAVPLFPSNRFPRVHTAAVTLGGLPAVLALLLFVVGIVTDPRRQRMSRSLTVVFATLVVTCLERIASITAVVWVFVLLPGGP